MYLIETFQMCVNLMVYFVEAAWNYQADYVKEFYVPCPLRGEFAE